ncbi:molybdopterin biosynthesis protein MoeA [Caulobacter sp. Root1455]|uniref:molybdopterin molybdotransferase MoeA n=1 Tax=Caulobacter sp. Root1455 TaxID=1736465 RepID=UPI0006F3B188|nr:molybdopterin molybdotransferase MoeA [Caulobacter sp. Root1455]KQY91435.1 molybdopterin biosynthesis protein MoeA [Caulobacter sp. Root1455]
MISFEQASALVADLAQALPHETVGLALADGRILAKPIVARRTSPATDVSAMDGYAARDDDLVEAPVRLAVIGEAYAGQAFDGVLAPGSCVRIFTGATAPIGTDRVVIQEEVRREGPRAVFLQTPRGGRNLRAPGSDFAAGDVLVEPGVRLNAQRMVAAAAADLARVSVISRPRVLIISTGEELDEPGRPSKLRPGIPESVSFGVASLVRAWGGKVVDRWRLGDDLAALETAARSAVGRADVVVVTGGASVGERDFAKAMFAPLDLQLIFSKVAIKPGKPIWIGRASGALVVGLPGNPTSALVTARLFLAPLIAGLAGLGSAAATDWRSVALTGSLGPCGDRETFVRGRRTQGGVEPIGDQDSSAQKALVLSDVLIRRRPGDAASETGALVEILDF